MENKSSVKGIFIEYLKTVSFYSWLLKLVPILIGILTAKLMSEMVSKATVGDIEGILVASGSLLAVVIGLMVFNILANTAYKKVSSQALHKCKISLYHQFLSNPLHVLYQSKHGDAIEKLNDDFGTLTGKYLSFYPEFWVGIITTGTYFIFITLQSPYIGIALLAISVLQIIPPAIIKKYMQVNYDDCRNIEAELTNFIIEGYRGFASIKLYNLKKWWLDKLNEIHREYLKIGNKATCISTAEKVMESFLDNILKYGTYGIIGLFVLFKLSSLETGVQAIALSGGLFSAVKTMFFSITGFGVAKMAEDRLSEWFNVQENDKGGTETRQDTEIVQSSKIQLSGVTFSYNNSSDNRIIMDNVSVSLDSRRITVIKGPNGTGKSTLFKIIAGLIKCSSGRISIECANHNSLQDINSLHMIFYLPQEVASFEFSAKELYRMAIPERAEYAEKIASEFGIAGHLVSESKISELSGGERKKVFLALAFALDRPILLLDEPTNSLDEESKTILCDKLKERSGGAVIITHESMFDPIAGFIYSTEDRQKTWQL